MLWGEYLKPYSRMSRCLEMTSDHSTPPHQIGREIGMTIRDSWKGVEHRRYHLQPILAVGSESSGNGVNLARRIWHA